MIEKMLNKSVTVLEDMVSRQSNTRYKIGTIFFKILSWLSLIIILIPMYIWCLILFIIAALVYKVLIMEIYELTDEQRIWCKENKINVIDFTVFIESSIRAPAFCNKAGIVKFKNQDDAMAFKLRWT